MWTAEYSPFRTTYQPARSLLGRIHGGAATIRGSTKISEASAYQLLIASFNTVDIAAVIQEPQMHAYLRVSRQVCHTERASEVAQDMHAGVTAVCFSAGPICGRVVGIITHLHSSPYLG